MIWWDYAQDITPERAKPFIDLIQSHPQLISNDRLGGGFQGDLGTPEQHIPESGPSETGLGSLHDDERHLGLHEQ